jgi:hypothetical protein
VTEVREMTTLVRNIAAGAALAVARVAQATGDSGTEAVGEMNITGSQFLMMVAGLLGLAAAVWLVVRAMNR